MRWVWWAELDTHSTDPGRGSVVPLGRAQAIELLRQYFRPAEERGLDVTVIREVEPGKGFVELTRRYVVAGTTNCDAKPCFSGTGYWTANGVWWSYGAHRNRLSCGPLRESQPPVYCHGSARIFSRFPEHPVEGTFERAPHLRAL